MQIHALSTSRYADAVDLFASNPSTRGCWCQHPLLTTKQVGDGWGDGNQLRFEELAGYDDPPGGLLAYDDNGTPIGWCATGPRSRYARALRSPLMTQRDPGEDDAVWLVPCFFVRSGHRRTGVTHQLLLAAIDHSRHHGATAIEGFPLAGPGPHKFNRYLGTEPLFTACGFTVTHRPSEGRAIMRLTHNAA
jgi:GNAT superfamily N-acetyltransferase